MDRALRDWLKQEVDRRQRERCKRTKRAYETLDRAVEEAIKREERERRSTENTVVR